MMTVSAPDHLVPLAGRHWALWRWVVLRGAGFPAARILTLSAPGAAAAADRLLAAERAASEVPALATHAHNEALERALAAVQEAEREYDECFDAERHRQSAVISDLVADSRLREAVAWQNRNVLHNAFDWLHRHPPGAPERTAKSKWRRKELVVASYLQRYCVKNDSIGFFGPVGWARLSEGRDDVEIRPGSGLLAGRHIYFETWGIAVVAERLAGDRQIRRWIPPRRNPTIAVDGASVRLSTGETCDLSPEEAALLALCTGTTPAIDLVAHYQAACAPLAPPDEDVYRLLECLQRAGLIRWDIPIPLDSSPEQSLRQSLERIGDPAVRASSLSLLHVLEQTRSALSQAAGDPVKVDRGLNLLDTVFSSITREPPTRAAGKTYGARTLVYEDCRRDIEVELGSIFLEALTPPLTLLLDSARWLTAQAIDRYHTILRDIYSSLAAQSGDTSIPFNRFWRALEPCVYDRHKDILAPLVSEFQRRWADILCLPAGARTATYTCTDLHPGVGRWFTLPTGVTVPIPYHSPDILVAAADTAAIQRGDFQLVMGELHMGTNTTEIVACINQHPAPEELFHARRQDEPYPRFFPIIPTPWERITSRLSPGLVLPADYHLAFSYDACGKDGWNVLPVGSLVIEPYGDRLVISSRDCSLRFDAANLVTDLIRSQLADSFDLFAEHDHLPRISFDKLVVRREQWRFPADTLTFAEQKSEAARFLAARRWRRVHCLPRFLFFKSPVELKPLYLDLDSPTFVELLATQLRHVREQESDSTIVITEMLPDLSQMWLPDAEDQCYSSELRLVAVDCRR